MTIKNQQKMEDNIFNIAELTDFQGITLGTIETEAEMDNSFLNYLQKTRNEIAKNPQLYSNQQNPGQLLEMFDYMLKNWDNKQNRVAAIKILAAKEKELLAKGYINYDRTDLSYSNLVENTGIFSVLNELYNDEYLEGLLYGVFQKVGAKIKQAHQKRVEQAKKVIPKLNKVNPATIAVRNALRGIIALNFLGIATSLSQTTPKAKEVLEKVKTMFKNMGGDEKKLLESIQNGAKKKPLFNKKMQEELETEKYGKESVSGLGEPISIGALLVACGGFFLKIWNWIKGAGFELKPEQIENLTTIKENVQNNLNYQDQQPDVQSESIDFQTGKTMDNNVNTSPATENKWKKPLLILGGLAAVGGLAYAFWPKQERTDKKSKQNSKPEPKLSGFALK
jgi:hypothetical protein